VPRLLLDHRQDEQPQFAVVEWPAAVPSVTAAMTMVVAVAFVAIFAAMVVVMVSAISPAMGVHALLRGVDGLWRPCFGASWADDIDLDISKVTVTNAAVAACAGHIGDGTLPIDQFLADPRLCTYDPAQLSSLTSQEAGSDDAFTFVLSLTPLRRIMKDYFVMCESYYQAIRTAAPSRIQSIDIGRRALHEEGSDVLVERLKGKIIVDRDTARRLFTLICTLHWKG
jgi:hypothetical protein